MQKKISENEHNEDKLIKAQKIIFGFMVRNEKLYMNKITTPEGTIYEYKNDYEFYLKNKKLDIKNFLNEKFNNLEIIEILVDNVRWKHIENLKETDVIDTKTVKIKIKKPN